MTEKPQQPTENYLTYGSIVSLMLDFNESNTASTLSFDPDKHNKKKDSRLDSPASGVSSVDVSQRKGIRAKVKQGRRFKNGKKNLDFLLTKKFLFSQGVFSNNCFFYQFKTPTDLELNYLNTLFLIIPASENESLQKIKNLIKKIEKDIRMIGQEDKTIYQQSTDIFIKFKQEIQTNHELATSILKKKTFVNFGDTVQFLHIASGKFLKFKKNADDLKIYIELSPKMSSNTVFRICHGYNYQSENSTNVFLNLGIKIACGDKPTNREKYLANGSYTIDGLAVKPTKEIKPNDTKKNLSINKSTTMQGFGVRTTTFMQGDDRTKSNRFTRLSSTMLDFGKKISIDSNQIISDDKSFNQWKLIKYSGDYLYDDNYLNNLDLFWIENCEKDAYLTSNEISESQLNYIKKRASQQVMTQRNHLPLSSSFSEFNFRETEGDAFFLSKPPDKEEKFPVIQSNNQPSQSNNSKTLRMKSQTNIRGFNLEDGSIKKEETHLSIPLNYFYDDYRNSLHFYQVGLQPIITDFKDPLGIFKFEIVTGNGLIEDYDLPNVGPLTSKTTFRIRNMFSNKVLCVENSITMNASISQFLKLINYSDIKNENICKPEDTLFLIETAYEQKKKDTDEDIIKQAEGVNGYYIKKTDTVRIRSKKYNSYLAVRQIRNENKAVLLLTKNLSDLTIFKMTFLYERDKYELQFLEQLNYAFEAIQAYFKKATQKSIERENFNNIQHILRNLRSMVSEYKAKKGNVNNEECNTLDLLRNLNQFGIIQKLMETFLVMWFKNYKNLSSEQLDSCLEDAVYSETLTCKKCVTQEILKIIKMVYDLDNSFIICIQDKLHYFFKFVGYIDKCTKFLIHILRNNHSLLLKLLSLEEIGKDSKIFEEMKKSFSRIIKYYNSLEKINLYNDFKSFTLLYDLFNTMLICNDEPFHPFYEVFFKNFNLIQKDQNTSHKIPNIEDNPILVHFFIKNDKIYIRKKNFITDKNNESEIVDSMNNSSNNIDDGTVKNTQSGMINRSNSSQKEPEYIEADLSLENANPPIPDDEEGEKEKKIISKIISLNILLYSNLSLHDDDFKEYLGDIFKMSIVNSFIGTNEEEEKESNPNATSKPQSPPKTYIDNDIKCSLIRMINFLYLKIAPPLVDNMGLCRNINSLSKAKMQLLAQNKKKHSLSRTRTTIDKDTEIPKIIANIESTLRDQAANTNVINDTGLLMHVFESAQYIMRHIYTWTDAEKKKEKAYDFIALILIILEGYIGGKAKKASSEYDEEESKELLINMISGDKITLNNKIHIVSSEYMRIYEIFRKKFYYFLTSSERKKKKYSTMTSSFSFTRMPSKSTLQKERTNIFSFRTPTKKETMYTTMGYLSGNQNDSKGEFGFSMDTKTSRKEIVIRISNIFLEFMKYIENEYVNRIEDNLVKLKGLYESGTKALEIKNEKNEIVIDDKEEEKRTNTILLVDILKMAYIEDINKLEDYLNINSINSSSGKSLISVGNSLDLLYDFSRVFKSIKQQISKKEEYYMLNNDDNCISEIFLKCIQKLDIIDLKLACLEILFRLNSQNFIFFENLSNLVIFANQSDLEKFENIKSIFLDLFTVLKNLFSTSVLDSTIIVQIEKFGEMMNVLMSKVFDKKKWIAKCEELQMYNNIEEDTKSMNTSQQLDNSPRSPVSRISQISKNQNEIDNQSNNNVSNNQPNNNNNGNSNEDSEEEDDKDSPYFLTKITDERVQLVQQVLFNLGFSDLLIKFMEKSNQIIIKFSEAEQNDPNYTHYSKSVDKIQRCLDDIYRLLGLFIKNNKKHQVIIEEQIELILFPISLTNNITTSVMISLSSFLLEFLRDFSVNELNNVENFIKMLTMLIQFDWKTKKVLIPYWVEILKIVIKSSSNESYEKLIECLNSIKNVLIEDIITNQYTNNDIVSLKEILELIIYLKQINLEDYENKARMLLSLNDIINKFFDMIKDTFSFAILLNLVIKYLDENLSLYKDEFELNKLLKRKLIKVVCAYCEKVEIKEDIIYSNINNDEALYHLNYFYGISLLKLYSIFNVLTQNENSNTLFESCASLTKVSETFYQVLSEIADKKIVTNTFINLDNLKDCEDVSDMFKGKFTELNDLISEFKIRNNLVDERMLTVSNYARNNNFNTITDTTNNKTKILSVFSSRLDKSENFVNYWNMMRKHINSSNKLRGFHRNVRKMINFERENFIRNLSKFITKIDNTKNAIDMGVGDIKSTKPGYYFFKIIHTVFKEFMLRNPKRKQELYFFYWIVIHLMRYDIEKDTFTQDRKIGKMFLYENTPLNKDIFSDKKLIMFAMKSISKKNLKCIDYEMMIYFKFFNAYLNGLNELEKSTLFDYLINSGEGEKFYLVMKNILDNLKGKLVKLASVVNNEKVINGYERVPSITVASLKRKMKNEEFSMNKFENEINPYEQVIQLLNNLSENNTISNNQMKEYLRYQYNSGKSLNFISVLANLLDFFMKQGVESKNSLGISSSKSNGDDNRMFINAYFGEIINIIETLTKCCQGPSFENQNSLVKDTKILLFMKQILIGMRYRKKENKKNKKPHQIDLDNNTNTVDLPYTECCLNLGLTRKRLSFLKFKLLILLSVLTIGRKKGDKIYEIIHKEIDFAILQSILEETYREILVEKGCEMNPNDLVFGDEIYLRYENFNYSSKADPRVENEHFIIFEVGTFVYIIMNIYYDNLTRPTNFTTYNQITKFKKDLTKEKTEIVKESIFENFFCFCKSLYRVLLQIFICFKYCNCGEMRNKEEDFELKDNFKLAYELFFNYTPKIEVMFNDQIIGYYVKLFPKCKYLTSEMKEEFQSNLDRTNTKSKLECLFKNVEYYKYSLEHSQMICETFKKFAFTDVLFNQYLFYKDLALLISIAINFLIISSYYRISRDTEDYDYGFLYKESNKDATKKALKILSLLQLLFSILIFVNYMVKNLPKYTFKKSDSRPNKCKRVALFFLRMFMDYYFIYHIIYLVFTFLGFISKNYLYFSFLLVEIVPRSQTLMYIIKSFWIPKNQLIVTLFLFYLFEYYFVIFVYLWIPDQLPTKDCFRFDDCLFTIFDQTFKNSNGIINFLSEDNLLGGDLLLVNVRFWIDNLFAIIEIILILQMVAGIIIDSFSALRQGQGEVDEDRYNVCLICGLHRTELNKLYGNEEGYNEHIKMDHYFWNYMFLVFNLLMKNPKELMGIDQLIFKMYKENQSTGWIPFKTCRKKVELEERNGGEDKEKEDEEKDDD